MAENHSSGSKSMARRIRWNILNSSMSGQQQQTP